MNDSPIYFSIVEFQERIGYRNIHSVIHLDIPQGELSYQVYEWKKNAPSIIGIEVIEVCGEKKSIDFMIPGKIIKSQKNNFQPEIFKDNLYEQKVIFNYGVKLSNTQKVELLKYCNAIEFEPYRNKEMSMSDPGYIGYRDEVSIKFVGITNSYIPKMEWDMSYYYDEDHIWPSEKLYRYLLKRYLQNEETKGWVSSYGAFSITV